MEDVTTGTLARLTNDESPHQVRFIRLAPAPVRPVLEDHPSSFD
jgi:hypothetical protein